MADFPRMRKDMGLNDMVSVEMPAHMWVALMSAYNNADWVCGQLNMLLGIVQEKVYDPLWLNEQQAAAQQHMDGHVAHLQRFLGQTPEMPPGQEEDT